MKKITHTATTDIAGLIKALEVLGDELGLDTTADCSVGIGFDDRIVFLAAIDCEVEDN